MAWTCLAAGMIVIGSFDSKCRAHVVRNGTTGDATAIANLMKTHPTLRNGGVAAVLDDPTAGQWIIGVGKAVVTGESVAALARAERVATLKAKAAIVADRDGVFVSQSKHVEERVDRTTTASVASVERRESRSHVLTERAEGPVKGVVVLG